MAQGSSTESSRKSPTRLNHAIGGRMTRLSAVATTAQPSQVRFVRPVDSLAVALDLLRSSLILEFYAERAEFRKASLRK